MAKQEAIQDRNNAPALLIHSGTADTADTIRATGQASGAQDVHITGGTVVTGAGTQPVNVLSGTQQTLGTVGVLNAGSVVVTAGTVDTELPAAAALSDAFANPTAPAVGAFNMGWGGADWRRTWAYALSDTDGNDNAFITGARLQGWTGAAWVRITGDATNGLDVDLTRGTVTAVNNLVTGTLAVVTSVSNLVSGTLAAVTSVTNLASGTLAVVTSVTNLAGGTVSAVNNIVTGTLATLGTIGVVNAGSVVVTAGTVKHDPTPIPTILQWGTQAAAAGSAFGTISAASGAGTKHYVSGVTIVEESGTADVRILFGTAITGGSVITAGKFPAGGGIAHTFNPALASGTNSEITYHFVGAGTAFITVQYWKNV